MIIGITGTLAAGKSTVAKILVEKGFKHYSVREFIIKEIEKRGLSINRDNMLLIANDLRQQNSPSYIAEELYKIANTTGGNAVIESLRTPGEIMNLRDKPNFHMLSVDTDPQIRYRRILERRDETDQVNFEKFIKCCGLNKNVKER